MFRERPPKRHNDVRRISSGERLEPRCLLAAQFAITEFMADNDRTLFDEEGASSDWIEIRNIGDELGDLTGFHLTDDRADLTRWTFPSVTLERGESLVVFASGRNRRNAEGELHTNFRLARDGEYLGLVSPDGQTIVDDFGLAYPQQFTDVSFGWGEVETTTELVHSESEAKSFVPRNRDSAGNWQGQREPFDDSGWTLGRAAIGFDVRNDLPRSDENIAREATATASGPVWNGFPPSHLIDGNPATISHPLTPVSTFHYTIDLGSTETLDRITIRGRGDGCCPERLTNYRVSIWSDSSGKPGQINWSADVRTDGSNPGPGGIDTITPELDAAGSFEGRFVRIEKIDEGRADYWPQIAEVEVFAAAGYHGLFVTDVEDQLFQRNASIYLRVPFVVEDEFAATDLTLEMRYDDGFVAFINGSEIASDNVPDELSFDSAAVRKRNASSTVSFAVPPDSLTPGQNMLAIQGLNIAADDPDFLILPRLIAKSVEMTSRGYLLTPTPARLNVDSVDGFVEDVDISVGRGFFDSPFDVTLSSTTKGATLVYTTDGSKPSASNGMRIFLGDDVSPSTTMTIPTTTTLRAAAFKDRFVSTGVETRSYLFPEAIIRQPAAPDGFPEFWDGLSQDRVRADYEVDPEVVDDPAYRDEIVAGLKSIPTISIVMNPDDLFGAEEGIYIHSGQRGRGWERETSVEIIEPDGTSFQANSGVRIHGFSWRFHRNTLKHSLRLEFRDEYGPSKLEYPLFPQAEVERFDSIVLRAQGGRSWAGTQFPRDSQYLRDTFARDLAQEMGAFDGHANLVHLYLNGLYWGLYNPVERPDAQMGAEYFGGASDDYDALNRRTSTMEVIDGDLERYNQMIDLAERALAAGVTTEEDYAQFQRFVAIDDFIDWMIRNQYLTNRDGLTAFEGNNQRAIGSRVGDPQFRFFVWDMEYSLWSATDNNNIAPGMNRPPLAGSQNPRRHAWTVYNALRQNPDFRLRFADHVRKHFFHNGALTPERSAEIYDARAKSIESAIIAESARWGDAKRRRPYTRDVEWQAERNRLLQEYFPQRSGVLLEQYKEVDLYPDVPPADFRINGRNQHGGDISGNDELTFFQASRIIAVDQSIIGADQKVLVHVPQSEQLAKEWRDRDYVEGTHGEEWIAGENGVGFDSGPDYREAIKTDVGEQMIGKTASVYIRIPFDLQDVEAIRSLDRIQLRMLVDDGFVAFLNGTEIARSKAPPESQLTWDAEATASSEIELDEWAIFDITRHKDKLAAGSNVLAIHGLNRQRSNRDMLIHAELVGQTLTSVEGSDDIWFTVDGSDPRLPGGAVNNGPNGGTAQRWQPDSQVVLTGTTQVRARARNEAGEWSALTEAVFHAANDLVISEIHFNPADPSPAELARHPQAQNDDFEFIELFNRGSSVVHLANWRLEGGIQATLPEVSLSPGERTVVVSDPVAFSARYGESVQVVGKYIGRLDNGGERIQLVDPSETVRMSVRYADRDPWYTRADGIGASLELRHPRSVATETVDSFAAWRASTEIGGSPGREGIGPIGVIINEVVANSPRVADSIELKNTTNRPIDIGGWYLSDSSDEFAKYEILSGTVLGPGRLIAFSESDFNAGPDEKSFGISSFGDDLWLTTRTNDAVWVVDDLRFPGMAPGESYGTIRGNERPMPLRAVTLGNENSAPRVGPIVISEVNYAPSAPTAAAAAVDAGIRSEDLEFIELFNTTGETVDLQGWKLRKGVSFDFPPGSEIGPRETIILAPDSTVGRSKTLDAFRTHYGLANAITIYGYEGRLDNAGELIQLSRRGHRANGNTAFYLEDEILFDDRAPWPATARGGGDSLHRTTFAAPGSNRSAWQDAPPSPGVMDQALRGDFNRDGSLDHADIDLLFAQMRATEFDPAFDLTQDGRIDEDDRDAMVLDVLVTIYGDANLDGIFDSRDFVHVFTAAEYEDDQSSNSTWSTGDWNGDAEFTTQDLVLAFQFGAYVRG